MDPIAGVLQFLIQLRSIFDESREKYFAKRELQTSPKATRALIYQCEEKGSFQLTWHAGKEKTKPTMNDDYIHSLLRLTPSEIESIQQKPEETPDAYNARFFRDRDALYQEKYCAIAQEIKSARPVP